MPQLGQTGRPEADLVAGQADGARTDRDAELRVHVEERGADDLDRGGTREPAPADEGDLQACRLHRRRDLRAAAVHDDGVAEFPEIGADHGPAHLHDDHVVYSALIFT